MPRIPEKIGKYIIKRLLGRGGMGQVYQAYDPIIGRDVALKVMNPELAEDHTLKERFVREAQSAGRLRHPNIVTIYDLGEENGVPYIAMEYLEGVDLDEVIRKKVDLTLEMKLRIILQASDALAYAHRHGIIHRDIKPANIRLVDDLKTVKIMDFGIAKLGASHFTQTGIIMGTPHYMSPEQIRDLRDKIDGRTDVFALGVVFYQLLTGKRPFDGEQFTTVFYKIVHEPPPPLTLAQGEEHAHIVQLVHEMIEKDPEKRPTAEVVVERIQAILTEMKAKQPTVHTAFKPEQPTQLVETPTRLVAPPVTPTEIKQEQPPPIQPQPVPTPSPVYTKYEEKPEKSAKTLYFILPGALILFLLSIGGGYFLLSRMFHKEPGQVENRIENTDRQATTAQETLPQGEPAQQELPQITPPDTSPAKTNEENNPVKSETPPPPEKSPAESKQSGPQEDIQKKIPSQREVVPPPPVPQKGIVVIDIQPWAYIEKIVKLPERQLVSLKDRYTPLRIELPEGTYEMTITHPAFLKPKTIRFHVKPNKLNRVTRTLRKFRLFFKSDEQ